MKQSIYDRLPEIFSPADNPSSDWYYYGPKGLSSQSYGIVSCAKFDRSDPTNPDIIYLAVCFAGLGRDFYFSQDIMKTVNGGKTWTSALTLSPSDRLPVTKLVFDPFNPSRILAFGSNKIYKSVNGYNFTELQNIPSAFCSSGVITWLPPKVVKDVVFKPGSSEEVYIATDFVGDQHAELWKITNIFSDVISSSDFLQINTLPGNNVHPDCLRFSLDLKNSTSGIPYKIFGGALYGDKFSVFEIDMSNSVFIPLGTVEKADMSSGQCEFEMSDINSNGFIVCGNYFRYFENNWINAKQHFNEQSPGNTNEEIYHIDTRSLDYLVKDGKEMLLIGNDGGVARAVKNTSYGDYVFNNANGRGLYITQFYGLGVHKNNPSKTVCGAQDNRLMTFGYPDPVWKVSFAGDGYNGQIHPSNPDLGYFFMGGGDIPSGLLRTNDGFSTHTQNSIVNYVSTDNKGANDKPIVLNPVNPIVAYVGFQDVYRAPDWNTNFNIFFDHTTLPNLIQDQTIVDIAIAPSDPAVMYVAYNNCCWSDSASLAKSANANDPNPTWSKNSNGMLFNYVKDCGITAFGKYS